MTDHLQQLGADLLHAAQRRHARRRRSRLIRAAVAACLGVAGVALVVALSGVIGSQKPGRPASTGDENATRTVTTEPASCDLGSRPGYFVPGDGPAAVVGCARLGVSGRLVDFSVNSSRIDGAEQLCINPAFGDGRFIPAVCKLEPPVSEFAIRQTAQPRQHVGGYDYVIWGTAGTARSVVGRFDGGVAHAAMLPSPPDVARDHGVRPFELFVMELPVSAACEPVTVEADEVTTTVDPDTAMCARAP